MENERDILKSILQFLAVKKIFCWRNNVGATVSKYKGVTRFIRYGYKGSSDVLGILPDGRFFAIEVKRKGNKTTEAQDIFLDEIKKNNGFAMVAYSIDDVIEAEQNLWRNKD